ncbi:amino acid adenylation domain-containing protein [Dendronalium sp. ChiSLP03b]|uniref:amino acid adenylation domain-containing protein n=1 Tax=Dendronalium sp. ChiSLP03b TaxID=3075381 RepID=UPI002AD44A50|nr:amino acid adenylation domain-containing protein [Dendronalium sp. ChiSLP03b]MDZ8206111.1 amino acid adenylation domain-containing protein [Dendronalium sp. ChiSLP03b]
MDNPDAAVIIPGHNVEAYIAEATQLEQTLDAEQGFCFHKWFETQVEQKPDAVAVIFADKQLTYRELNHRANQLAHYLQAMGVGAESLVGIYMERSLEIVVGLLAILKAGGAYVPLDPAYPKERIAFIVEETQVTILLTQKHLLKELPQLESRLVCLDTEWNNIARESKANPASEVTPENLAYVIYTSGSTGKPKGVEMPHISISNYVQSLNQILQINSEDIYLHTASFSFSSSLRQLMLPLTQGAKIVMATQEQIKNPLSLFELIKQQQVTVFDTVQSVWRYLLQALEELDDVNREQLLESKLRLLLFSGGLLPNELFKKVRSTVKAKARIVNIYGQTETIGVCAYPVPEQFDRELVYLPIGRPYPYVELYLLDENLQPVSVGDVGEIHIAGAGLASGYLNLPKLTQEKFIPYPFSKKPGTRLYKTGDLARYLPDGNLECVGRADFQVKIRGIRIELGEIESTILTHPGVREVVVVTRTINISGEPSLVGYIVLKPEQTLTNKELRNYLRDKLPDYMIPVTFVMLEALPLTPNGKIDRAALPAPNAVRQESKDTYVAPRNELELQLTKIWEKVLGVQPIGVTDNFFELGGNSLIAARLIADIERIWNRKLPLAILLETLTVEQLADVLRQEEQPENWTSSLVPIQPNGSKPPLFCIHPVGGNVLDYYHLANYLGREQPVYGLQAQGLTEKQQPLTCIEDMANHYIQEIRTIQQNGPYFLAGYSFGGVVAFEMAQQLHAQGQKVALLGLFDVSSPTLQPTRSSITKFLRVHLSNLKQLKPQQRLKYVKNWVQWRIKGGNYKDVLINELSDTSYDFRVLETNWQAKKNYQPQVYPGTVTLFRSKLQPVKFGEQLDLGWGDLVSGGLKIHSIAGDHYSVLREASVKELAEKLKFCLEQL